MKYIGEAKRRGFARFDVCMEEREAIMRGLVELAASDLSSARSHWVACRSEVTVAVADELLARAAAVLRQLVPSCGRAVPSTYRRSLPALPPCPTDEGFSYPVLVDPRCRFADLKSWGRAVGDRDIWGEDQLGTRPYWAFCEVTRVMDESLLNFSKQVESPAAVSLGWEGIYFLRSYAQALPAGETLLLATHNPASIIQMERKGSTIEYRVMDSAAKFSQASILTCQRVQ